MRRSAAFRVLSLAAISLLAGILWVSPAKAESLLGYNDWHLVGHMSNSGGMFDGGGELASNYNYGAFVTSPTATTADFFRAFPITAPDMRILFITGNRQIWGMADYEDLLSLVNARQGVQTPNLYFDVGINGVTSSAMGNVLSRTGSAEDPWISIQGSHGDGVTNQRIVWGENNYSAGAHQNLKNNNGGMDVFIRAVPEPSATSFLLMTAGTGLALRRRHP